MRTLRWMLPAALCLSAACSSSYMRPGQPMGAPGPNESKIVVYRRSLFGAAVTFPIYDGTKLIGFTEKGAYFEYKCPPGKRVLVSWGENEVVAAGDLLPGKTYYIRGHAKMGFFSAGAGMDPINRDDSEWATIESLVAKLDCHEVDPERAAKHEAKRREKAEKILKEYETGEEKAALIVSQDGK